VTLAVSEVPFNWMKALSSLKTVPMLGRSDPAVPAATTFSLRVKEPPVTKTLGLMVEEPVT
jgi:hypothetical protein